MTDHNCVRNPDTGTCYVCDTLMRSPMRNSPLDLLLDTIAETNNTSTTPDTSNRARCTVPNCLESPVHGISLCIEHWIADQTRPRTSTTPAKPKHISKSLDSINLDSIVSAMHSKWQN